MDTSELRIDGIVSVSRDVAFDDIKCYTNGGIRLKYENAVNIVEGSKEGILLEAGFDTTKPNSPITISSWAYDKAIESKVEIVDNRAAAITCYHPGYTFVEKLQTIASKFRGEQKSEKKDVNFMRQYYDVYCLLGRQQIIDFIDTEEYRIHKKERFSKEVFAIPVSKNEAFLLSSPEVRADFAARYKETAALYYQGQPDFDELLKRIASYSERM